MVVDNRWAARLRNERVSVLSVVGGGGGGGGVLPEAEKGATAGRAR